MAIFYLIKRKEEIFWRELGGFSKKYQQYKLWNSLGSYDFLEESDKVIESVEANDFKDLDKSKTTSIRKY